jgi:hypothetical protein
MRMHACEFCLTNFECRPQVKSPRACLKPECQRLRQRANEREWRDSNPKYLDKKYHQCQREGREKRIVAITEALKRCLSVGRDLLGLKFKADEIATFLKRWLLDLGMRQINKFWSGEIQRESTNLEGGLV